MNERKNPKKTMNKSGKKIHRQNGSARKKSNGNN